MKLTKLLHINWIVLIFLIFKGTVAFSQDTGTGYILDDRDGQVYKTIDIGNQKWMGENLNFGKYKEVSEIGEVQGTKHCYDNDTSNCEFFGGLYTWYEANSDSLCPDGWHLPSRQEWQKLSEFLGEKYAGQKVKASPSDSIKWDGNNETGLTIIPAGASNGSQFKRKGQWAIFWTSSSNGDDRAWFAQLDGFWYPIPKKYTKIIIDSFYLKTNLFSVRCIKD